MRQLDLFGSFIETSAEEKKPDEKELLLKRKKQELTSTETFEAYSKNGLRSERQTVTTTISIENSPEFVEKKENQPHEITDSEKETLPSFGLFPEAFEPKEIMEAEITALETSEELILNEEIVEQTIESKNSLITENIEQKDVSATKQEEVFLTTLEPLSNFQKKAASKKTNKQKAPELERNGPVIFDDGKITVKIKNKSPFPAPIAKEKKEKPKKVLQKRGRKSFKEIDAEVDLIEIPEDEILFQKQYYGISEVAKWFRVNASLLRFWENEFDVLKPRKNRKGDRLFRPEDVKNLQLIYQLLRQRKYTIEGAKEYIKTNKKKADIQLQLTNTLQKFKSFLLDMKTNLQP